MRRSVHAGVGIAAGLFLAACSPDQSRQEPLAPTVPSLAAGGGSLQCAGSQASLLAQQQKALFTGAGLTDLDARLKTIKSQCSTTNPPFVLMMDYLQKTVDYRPSSDKHAALIQHWRDLILYVQNVTVAADFWTTNVLRAGSPPVAPDYAVNRSGGAAVLPFTPPPGLNGFQMVTFDGQAGVKISETPAQFPIGKHFFTFDPSACPQTALQASTPACYEIKVYPPLLTGEFWSPKITVGMCTKTAGAPSGILHDDFGYTEVLESVPNGFPWSSAPTSVCDDTHAFIDTWLGRQAGPLGRALARGLDFLRPQPLFAVDAGESGLTDNTSLFGGVFTTAFKDSLDNYAPGAFTSRSITAPDIGNSWTVEGASAPAFVQIQSGLGDLSGNVVVFSQGQGACAACPVLKLLATRANPAATQTDNEGSYQIYWSSVQSKPNIKDASFYVLGFNNDTLAKVSYVSQSNQNKIKFNNQDVPGLLWEQNKAQHFRITVNLQMELGGSFTTKFEVRNTAGVYQEKASASIPVTSTFTRFGYILDRIDAGIMGADNFFVKRVTDVP